jgi:hypothetical protein
MPCNDSWICQIQHHIEYLTVKEELLLNTIQENMAFNNNLYVVVYTVPDYVSMEQLEKVFVAFFTLGYSMNCVYIVKVEAEAIHGPLFVFRNYGSIGENVTKLFCTLPQGKWGKFFSDKINS